LNEIQEKSNCNGLNGKVVKIQSKISICLTNEKFIEINNANSGNYVVKGESSQFGITNSEYAIINVSDKIIKLNTKYKNNLKYLYVNILCDKATTTYRVMEKDDSCPKDSGTGLLQGDKILELECTNSKCVNGINP